MTSPFFNGFEPWAFVVLGLSLAYAFRLIPTIRITFTKEPVECEE